MNASWMDTLNEAQKKAVCITEGPLLILAGAGTGKTKVLTSRFVYILLKGLATHGEILSVTFTNKAAYEMKERIHTLLKRPVDGLWLGTFHSICLRILRRHAEIIDKHPSFTILDTDDQQRLIKQLLKAENIDDKKHPPRLISTVISRWKDKALPPHFVSPQEYPIALKIYTLYQERLKIINACDFGDLLLDCLTLFKKAPDVLSLYQKQFRYILVDEYQDTNTAQYLWLHLLAQGWNNLCCVGDDDQSIYGWRGAEVGNILKFEKDFPNTHIIKLEENYRSTSHILAAASKFIAHNKERLGKTLWTKGEEGEKLLIKATWDSNDEARYIGDEIETYQRKGGALKDVAVLVRAGFQTREFEERFLKIGLPYRIIGGLRFYERSEIKDALAYLRLLLRPEDSLAFERIINMPKRGIGESTLQALHQWARDHECSLTIAAENYIKEKEKGKIVRALKDFLIDFERWRFLLKQEDHLTVVKTVLDESGYMKFWMDSKAVDAQGRIENLKEFVNAIREFDSISSFLDHVSLVIDNSKNDQEDKVTIMTLHAAKGLEFNYVFLTGWEEGLFPHARSLQDPGGLEEERRLGYVGISRAKKRLSITYCAQRRLPHGWQAAAPSRFLKELPHEHYVHLNYHDLEISENFTKKENIAPLYKEMIFIKGERVFHQKFGYGKIQGVNNDSLDVLFDLSDRKKIKASFLEKA